MIRQLVLVFLLLSGCSKLAATKSNVDPAFFTAGDSSLNPATDKLLADCFSNAESDACIFQKNPVAQEKGTVAFSDLDSKRHFGVKIRGLAGTGSLENDRVRVFALNSARFNLSERAALKSSAGGDLALQFSSYYWSNRLFDYLAGRVGAAQIPLKGLKIYPDDVFSGYSAVNKSIHLAKKEGEIPKAFSGEIVIHLTAQALADTLSGGRLYQKDISQHNYCAQDPKGCCKTEFGCAQALGSGFGDYASAMMFPENARLGETLAASPEGQKICSVPRDLLALAGRSKTQVFSACEVKGRAALMGSWYASIWWKLRLDTEAREAGAGKDIDFLFFEHYRSLDSKSTFAEAKVSAAAAAAAYKNGLYVTSVTATFAAAGL